MRRLWSRPSTLKHEVLISKVVLHPSFYGRRFRRSIQSSQGHLLMFQNGVRKKRARLGSQLFQSTQESDSFWICRTSYDFFTRFENATGTLMTVTEAWIFPRRILESCGIGNRSKKAKHGLSMTFSQCFLGLLQDSSTTATSFTRPRAKASILPDTACMESMECMECRIHCYTVIHSFTNLGYMVWRRQL